MFHEAMMSCIRKFFAEEHPKQIPGRFLYPAVFETDLFFPLQRKRELAIMMSYADGDNPKTVMEIGADKGGGLYHWCQLPTVQNVIACEINGLPYAAEFEKAFPDHNFLWLPKPSLQAVDDVRVACSIFGAIDVLFIDGDKKGMRKDFDAFRPFVRDGGLIFLHDIRDDGPKQAWDSIVAEMPRQCSVILDETEGIEAGERADRGEPAKNSYDGWLRDWRGRSCGVGVVKVKQ